MGCKEGRDGISQQAEYISEPNNRVLNVEYTAEKGNAQFRIADHRSSSSSSSRAMTDPC